VTSSASCRAGLAAASSTWPPPNWNETLKNEDTQQRLDANVFRRASLGLLNDHRRSSSTRPRRVSDGLRRTDYAISMSANGSAAHEGAGSHAACFSCVSIAGASFIRVGRCVYSSQMRRALARSRETRAGAPATPAVPLPGGLRNREETRSDERARSGSEPEVSRSAGRSSGPFPLVRP